MESNLSTFRKHDSFETNLSLSWGLIAMDHSVGWKECIPHMYPQVPILYIWREATLWSDATCCAFVVKNIDLNRVTWVTECFVAESSTIYVF